MNDKDMICSCQFLFGENVFYRGSLPGAVGGFDAVFTHVRESLGLIFAGTTTFDFSKYIEQCFLFILHVSGFAMFMFLISHHLACQKHYLAPEEMTLGGGVPSVHR